MRNLDFPDRKLTTELLSLVQLWLLFIKYLPCVGHSTECHTNMITINTHNKPTNLVQTHNPTPETLGQDVFLNSELFRCLEDGIVHTRWVEAKFPAGNTQHPQTGI